MDQFGVDEVRDWWLVQWADGVRVPDCVGGDERVCF